MDMGNALLYGSTIATFAAMAGYARETWGRGSRLGLTITRWALYLHAALLIMTSLVMFKILLNHEFQYSYVFRYSSLDMPLKYVIASFWGGQEGTFLLWATYGGLLAVLLRFKSRYQEAPLLFFYMSITLFLLLMLIKAGPFARLPHTPPDGNGLNPLLQDPWMTIHPPIMFLGFASLGVPAAYALAAMLKQDWDRWVRQSLPWTILGVLTLGTGLTLGGYWSYSILGWGGYWGWDPVENSSLVPWLLAVALLHNQVIQRVRGKFRRVNLILAVLPFLFLTYSTFLTRSGVLADFSVHSFTDLGINQFLAAFMIVFFGAAAALFLWRFRSIPVERSEEAPASRERWIFLGAALLALFAASVCVGTSAPLLSRLWGEPANVQPDFYNRLGIPFVIAFMILTAWAPHAVWGTGGLAVSWRRVRVHLGLAAVAGIGFYLAVGNILLTTMLVAATWSLLSNGFLFWKLMRRRATTAGGMLAHAGLGFMVVGIVFSTTQDTAEIVELPQGQPVEALGYQLTFDRVDPVEQGKKSAYRIAVSGGSREFTLSPVMYYNETMGGMMRKPDIRFSPGHDLYISPGDHSVEPPNHRGRSRLVLRRGEETEVLGMRFRMEGFRSHVEEQEPGKGSMSVLADIFVSHGGTMHHMSPTASTVSGKPGLVPGEPVLIPGTSYAMTLDGVDATNGRVRLDVALPRVRLAEGSRGRLGDYELAFNSFKVDMGRGRGEKVEVFADVTLSGPGGTFQAQPGLIRRAGSAPEYREFPLESSGLLLALTEVDAGGKAAVFQLVVPPRQSLWVEVSRKPLIGFLWLGTALLIGGTALAGVRRFREAKLRGRSRDRRSAVSASREAA